jgi:hypothetical protein
MKEKAGPAARPFRFLPVPGLARERPKITVNLVDGGNLRGYNPRLI